MIEQSPPLNEQLRNLKYNQRLDQASLIDRCTSREERVAAATAIVRELAMQRIFDRFTCEQDTELLNRFASLAEMEEGDHPPPFGLGAVSSPRDKQATLF